MSAPIRCTDGHAVYQYIDAITLLKAKELEKEFNAPNMFEIQKSVNAAHFVKFFEHLHITCQHCKTILLTEKIGQI